jgi:4-aminobutyrate aminotransferase-like enzyme
MRELREDGHIHEEKAHRAHGPSSKIGDVRGLGLLIGVEIVKDREKNTPDPEAANAICAEVFKRGVYVLSMGSYGGRVIRVAPPLIITEEQADTVIEILEESIGKVEKG